MRETIKRIITTIVIIALAVATSIALKTYLSIDGLDKIAEIIFGVCSSILVVATVIGVRAMNKAIDKHNESFDMERFDEELREHRDRIENNFEAEKRRILRLLNWGTAYFWFIYLTLFAGVTCMFLVGEEADYLKNLSIAYFVWIYGLTGPLCCTFDDDDFGTKLKEKENPYLFGIIKDVFRQCGIKGNVKVYMQHQFRIGVAKTRWSTNVMIGAKAIALLDEQELRQALLHEAAHIKNKDIHMSYRLSNGYEKWNNFSSTKWDMSGIAPVYILCYLYSREYVFFNETSSRVIEVKADQYAAKMGNRQEAINGLAKVNIFDCYGTEYVGDGRHFCFREETLEKGIYKTELAEFKDMLSTKEGMWRKRIENYLIEDISSHPTFAERKELMGVDEYEITFKENSPMYEEMREQMIERAEQELYDSLIDGYDEMRKEEYLAPMKEISRYKTGELGNSLLTKVKIASLYEDIMLYDDAYMLYEEIRKEDPENTTAAYGIGKIKLMRYDNSGIQDMYYSLENRNHTDDKLGMIGAYCVEMGLVEEYEHWKQFKNEKLDHYYNEYDKIGDCWEDEILSKSDIDQELIEMRKRQILEIGQGMIDRIYLVKKQLSEECRMDAFLLGPKEEVEADPWEDMMHQVFLLLDNTSNDDVQYGLFCFGIDDKEEKSYNGNKMKIIGKGECQMRVEEVKENKKQFLDLLLLADEQESMIDRYLERGELFALYDEELLRGICVVTKEGDHLYEIKNIATYEKYHGMGYGKKLIDYVCDHYKEDCEEMIVGTGDSPLTIPFYEKCGFKEYRRVKNFFTDHYDHVIIEAGKQLVDMVYLKKRLK